MRCGESDGSEGPDGLEEVVVADLTALEEQLDPVHLGGSRVGLQTLESEVTPSRPVTRLDVSPPATTTRRV
jgi:hypothetical protein